MRTIDYDKLYHAVMDAALSSTDEDMIFDLMDRSTVDAVPVVRMNEITYMDCWQFIAPLIPVTTDFAQDVYVMTFHALKEAEEKRIAEKRKEKPKDEKN